MTKKKTKKEYVSPKGSRFLGKIVNQSRASFCLRLYHWLSLLQIMKSACKWQGLCICERWPTVWVNMELLGMNKSISLPSKMSVVPILHQSSQPITDRLCQYIVVRTSYNSWTHCFIHWFQYHHNNLIPLSLSLSLFSLSCLSKWQDIHVLKVL